MGNGVLWHKSTRRRIVRSIARTRLHNQNSPCVDDSNGHQAVGKPGSDAITAKGKLRDDLLEILGREGIRQLPRLGGARVQARGVCRSSRVGASRRLAGETGCCLRLRGIVQSPESSHLERGLPRVVALV